MKDFEPRIFTEYLLYKKLRPMKNFMVLHGHFYQPPRENPWTGLVPLQKSAYPYHDWNQRITRECYGANAFSRYLDKDGLIEDIVNNYEYLSFNFGPTLLGWLKTNAPNVYRKILEADKLSILRNRGHGNAIAQGYNHTILPLDSPMDAEIQILWGLKDFESHFNRESEGIWLPETAVNYKILDLLIQKGIKYIILSPWQADAVQPIESNDWQLMGDQPAPSNRAYTIEREEGSISLFFYNNILAQGISFGHYMQDGDKLYRRLLKLANPEDPAHLIHTATDGEIYGHHEPFGDMGLAALIKKINYDDKFILTNYGNYLEEHPPIYRARLKGGEENRGTSWSCFHGVSRWYKDCGCNTGGKEGWNQKWRTPVRNGYTDLSRKLVVIFESEIKKLSAIEPSEILGRYISVLTGSESREDFFNRVVKGESRTPEGKTKLFRLLEGQKFRIYTFTSCGWFFSELSGIEPVQNLKYAMRAIEIYNDFTKEDLTGILLQHLEKARSNIAEKGTGRDIYLSLTSHHEGEIEAAVYFLLERISDPGNKAVSYGNFSLLGFESTLSEGCRESSIKIADRTTAREFLFKIKSREKTLMDISVKKVLKGSDSQEQFEVALKDLSEDLRLKTAELFLSNTEKMYNIYSHKRFTELSDSYRYIELLDVPVSKTIRNTSELVANSQLKYILSDPDSYLSETDLDTIEELLKFVTKYKIDIEKSNIAGRLSGYLSAQFDKYDTHTETISVEYIYRLYKIARIGGIEPEITIPQNLIFQHIKKWNKILEDPDFRADIKTKQLLDQLMTMSGIVMINAETLRKKINRVFGQEQHKHHQNSISLP